MVEAAVKELERDLIARGLYFPPTPAVRKPREAHPPVRRRRQWPWYIVQIASFVFALWAGRLLIREGEDFGYAPALFAAVFALLVTVTIADLLDAVRRLAQRPVIVVAWFSAVAIFVGLAAYRFGPPGSMSDVIEFGAIFAVLSTYATILFAWVTRPLFRLRLFPTFTKGEAEMSSGRELVQR